MLSDAQIVQAGIHLESGTLQLMTQICSESYLISGEIALPDYILGQLDGCGDPVFGSNWNRQLSLNVTVFDDCLLKSYGDDSSSSSASLTNARWSDLCQFYRPLSHRPRLKQLHQFNECVYGHRIVPSTKFDRGFYASKIIQRRGQVLVTKFNFLIVYKVTFIFSRNVRNRFSYQTRNLNYLVSQFNQPAKF